MDAKFLTDCGQVRDHNEDAGGIFYNEANQLLAIIADGMGGHQAGDIASDMAVNIVEEEWTKSEQMVTPEKTEQWMSQILSQINTAIYNHSLESDEYKGMGTTAVITICCDDFITIGHIGDSRCYVYNQNGFKQLTEDHSLVNELIRTGQISTEDAAFHPRKNVVLRAVGTEEEVNADVQSLSWEVGNKLLLCSDGLTDKVSDQELFNFIKTDESLIEIGENMIDLANDRGGEDNISLIIINYMNEFKREGET